jgi:hypothetical protein
MAEAGSEVAAAADRLEAALERIATLASRPAAGAPNAPPEVAERLDALIAHLREALDGPPG